MGVDTTQRSGLRGRLFELYTRYVSEPESRAHVYGYTLLVVGYVLGMVGLLIFLLGPGQGSGPTAWLVQKIAAVPAALGLTAALLGIVLTLPVRRIGTVAALLGATLCVVAVGWFSLAYPQSWSQGTPSYSVPIIALYTGGMALVMGVVVMVPVVTGERSYFSETAEGREYDHPDIMIGDADRGALFALYKDGREWTWRLIEQRAVAASTNEFLSRIDTEERVDAIKDQVDAAGLIEIKHTAFRLYHGSEDAWEWYLMHEDGTVLGEGGHAFDTRDAAESSINLVKDHGADAEVYAIEEAAYEPYRDGGEWHWRLLDADRVTLTRSAGGHVSRDAALEGIDRARDLAADARTLIVESYGVELFESGDSWQWRLRDASNDQIATSVDTYERKGVAEDGVYDLLDALEAATVLEAGQPTYDVYPTDEGWRFRLVDDSGAPVALGRATDRQDAASDAAEQLRSGAPEADVIEVDDLSFETYARDGEWHWRLVAPDREVRARSTDGYETEADASSVVQRVRAEAPGADLLEFETAAFQVYEAESGQEGAWRWRLLDENGTVVADSGQGEYESKDDALGAMSTLQEHASDAERLEIETAAFELFEDDEGWGWRLVDDIGDEIAEGADRHETEAGARESMNSLIDTVSDTDQQVLTEGVFQVYADSGDEWWWRYVLPDGQVIADSPSGFGTRHDAEAAVEDVAQDADGAPIETISALAFLTDPSDWSWELVDTQRDPVAESRVDYDSEGDLEAAIEDLRREASRTIVYEIRDAAFDCYRTDEETWAWRLVDADHAVVSTSERTYEGREAVEEAVESVRSLSAAADLLDIADPAFELFADEEGWTWRFVDADKRAVAVGNTRHADREGAADELAEMRAQIADASVIEVDSATFEFDRTDEGWRWRLVAEDGTELARSVESFETRAGAQEDLTVVKEFGPDAWVSAAE